MVELLRYGSRRTKTLASRAVLKSHARTEPRSSKIARCARTGRYGGVGFPTFRGCAHVRLQSLNLIPPVEQGKYATKEKLTDGQARNRTSPPCDRGLIGAHGPCHAFLDTLEARVQLRFRDPSLSGHSIAPVLRSECQARECGRCTVWKNLGCVARQRELGHAQIYDHDQKRGLRRSPQCINTEHSTRQRAGHLW